MVEISLNVDPMGGLWPVMPAAATASDDDLEIDAAFAAILQSQPLQQAVMVHDPGFALVLGSAVQGTEVRAPEVQDSSVQSPTFAAVRGPELEGPEPEAQLAEAALPPPMEPPAPSPGPTPAPFVVHALLAVPQPLPEPPAESPAPAMHAAPATNPMPATHFVQATGGAPAPQPAPAIQPASLLDSAPATPQTPAAPPAPSRPAAAPHAVSVPSVVGPVATQGNVPEQATITTLSEPTPAGNIASIAVPAAKVSTSAIASVAAPTVPDATVAKVISTLQGQRERDEPADAPVADAPAPHAPRQSTASAIPIETPPTPTAVPSVITAAAPVVTVAQSPVVHETLAPAALRQTLVPTTDDGAPVMPRLVEMMRWQAREGGGQAELRLRPELLGAVTVSIVVENGAVKATVSAETPAALEYLRSESSGLQEALEERGLTLDEFEVREESPFTDRRRHDDERRHERQDAAPAPRRRVVNDSDAVFSVLA